MTSIELTSMFPWLMAFSLGSVFYASWRRDRREERSLKEQERREEREIRLREMEAKRSLEIMEEERRKKQADEEQLANYVKARMEEEDRVRERAGAASGGFIVVDIPDGQRGLFHDLLKGFEEYAHLKGYGVSFSVDNTFHGKIAFKFTLTDPDVIVVNERVRKDLREYLDKVSSGDSLDDMPKIISIQEHELLVATLKNRMSFLQHSYNLAKTSSDFYENIMRKVGGQPFLPAPNVFVQTGGRHSSPHYIAHNSPQATLGIENSPQNSIRVAVSFRERRE